MYELSLCVIEYDKTNTTKPLLATLLNVERLSSTYRAPPRSNSFNDVMSPPAPPKLVIIVEMPNRDPSIPKPMQQNLICHAA